MIYLAVPYSHPYPSIREKRFHQANRAAGKLIDAGHMVFSPISHSHPIAVEHGLPTDWSWWQQYDLEMLKVCSVLYVAKFDEWKESKGIKQEIHLAAMLGRRVLFWDPEHDIKTATPYENVD